MDRRRNLALIVLGFALTGGVAWMLSLTGEAKIGPLIRSTEKTSGTLTQDLAVPGAGAAGSENLESRSATAPARRDKSADPAETGRLDGWVRVRIVDGETREPAVDAEVAYMLEVFDWPAMTPEEQSFVQTAGSDTLRVYRRFGGTARTDAEGVIRVRPRTLLAVACAHGGRYAERICGARRDAWDAEYVVGLAGDFSPSVRVVGPGGDALQGFPVRLSSAPVNAAGMPGAGKLELQELTDANGVATFHHTARHQIEGGFRFQTIRMALHLPGVPAAPAVDVPWGRPPAEVPQLLAPPTGEVTVCARLPHGGLHGTYDDMSLDLADGGHSFVAVRPLTEDSSIALYQYVPLGLDLEAQAYTPVDFESLQVPGPALPGERVEIVLEQDPESVVLMGRLLLPDGEPAGPGGIELIYESGGDGGDYTGQLDDEGRFFFDFGDWGEGLQFDRAVIQLLDRRRHQSIGVDLGPLGPLQPGVNRCGDRVLGAFPTIVQGTAKVGGQLAKVDLNVEARRAGATEEIWDSLPVQAVDWESTGVFRVSALVEPGPLRLVVAGTRAGSCPPIGFKAGDRDVAIELEAAGELVVTAQLDRRGDARHLSVRLVPLGERAVDHSERHGRRGLGHRSGPVPTLRWSSLRPGPYAIEAYVDGSVAPVLVLGNVELRAGEATEAVLDLRGKLSAVELTVVTEGQPGDRPSESIAWAAGDAVNAEVDGARSINGVVTLVGSPPLDVWVGARGFVSRRVRSVTGPMTVELTPMPETRIAIDELAVPETLSATLVARSNGDVAPGIRLRHLTGSTPLQEELRTGDSKRLGPRQVLRIPARPGADITLEVLISTDDGGQVSFPVSPAVIAGRSPGAAAVTVTVDQAQLQRIDAR